MMKKKQFQFSKHLVKHNHTFYSTDKINLNKNILYYSEVGKKKQELNQKKKKINFDIPKYFKMPSCNLFGKMKVWQNIFEKQLFIVFNAFSENNWTNKIAVKVNMHPFDHCSYNFFPQKTSRLHFKC